MLRNVQLILTILLGILTAVVATMSLTGKTVDTATKTFTFGCMTTIVAFWFYVPKS
jgi:hypothetical protein